MDDKELSEFSWTTLFSVTSLSFFFFSGVIKLIDGDHFEEFMITGAVTFGLALICFLGAKLTQTNSK